MFFEEKKVQKFSNKQSRPNVSLTELGKVAFVQGRDISRTSVDVKDQYAPCARKREDQQGPCGTIKENQHGPKGGSILLAQA
jgi:hypothetical protein